MEALASVVKHLNSSTSAFFKAEITERALMVNMHLLPPFIFSVFPPLLPLCPPY